MSLRQVQHLRLHRDIEGRHRLVADDEIGLQRQRAGDADALALATGKGVRVAQQIAGIEPHQLEQLDHPVAALSVREVLEADQRLGDERLDIHARVERGIGILEHHLHAAPDALELVAAQLCHVDGAGAIVEQDLALAGLDGAEDGAAGRGFAAAAFPDEAERFAAHDGQVDAVDGPHFAGDAARQPGMDGEALAQPADLEQRFAHAASSAAEAASTSG
jgi:hypothetical protein